MRFGQLHESTKLVTLRKIFIALKFNIFKESACGASPSFFPRFIELTETRIEPHR